MDTARRKAYVELDGTLIATDRVGMRAKADRPYYSGKHKRHGLNVQVLTDPAGRLIWASPALPGSVHDVKAARHHGLVHAAGSARTSRTLPLKLSFPATTSLSFKTSSSPDMPGRVHTAGLRSEDWAQVGPPRRGAGPKRCRRRIVRIEIADTVTPSFAHSPAIRW
jgi:hypothetical protein